MLDTTIRDLFRWETLPAYEVASDGSDYRRYLDGADAPTPERKHPWLDTLRAWAEQGGPAAGYGSSTTRSLTTSGTLASGDTPSTPRLGNSSGSQPCRPELAATLRRLRQDAGLSGIEAARRAGLSQSTVSRLETGRRAPTVKEVAVLCKAYRAPAEVRAVPQATARDLQEGTTSARIVLQRPAKCRNASAGSSSLPR